MTVLELAVALVVMGMVTIVVERTLALSSDTDLFLDARDRARHRGGQLAQEVQRSVTSSRRIFARGTVGDAYLAALDLGEATPASGIRLPLPDDARPLGPDLAGDPRTGNALLVARETEPVACPADPPSAGIRYVDVYRFVCWFPRLTSVHVVSDEPQPALDLCVWRSVGYPSYPQIHAIEDPVERTRVVQHLCGQLGYGHAWDPAGPVDSSFHAMDIVGTLLETATSPFGIQEDVELTDGGRLVHAQVQLARTDPASPAKRAVFTADDPALWAPDGFEVKVTGHASCRSVWLRLAVEAQARRGQTAVHATTLLATARDL